jgi:S1-C subfamily serine protease
MIDRLICIVVIAVMCSIVAACATTGHSVTTDVTAPRTVKPPSYVHPELALYLLRFMNSLETFGFRVAQTDDPRAMQLRLDFDPSPFHMRVTASLWQAGMPLVTVEALNAGWGTVIAHSSAVANLVESAATSFEAELRKVAPRLEITADAFSMAPQPPTQGPFVSTGTAFAVLTPTTLVTAFHAVKGAKSIEVSCGSGLKAMANIEKIDPANDLALIKTGLPAPAHLDLAPDNSLTIGQKVFTVGFPVPDILGLEAKYAEGSVSSLTGLGGAVNLLQITVPLQPGNSGGPLSDEAGRVVGVVTSSAAVQAFLRHTGTLPQNVNWSVRSEYLRPILTGVFAQTAYQETSPVERVRKSVCLIRASSTLPLPAAAERQR